MKKENNVKSYIILSFTIIIFLFTICIALYKSDQKKDLFEVNTSFRVNNENDLFSIKLQNIIPYVTTNDSKYITAYQDDTTNISNVHNDVILTKGYFNNIKDYEFKSEILLNKISDLYGNDIFIVNKDFNVNGKDYCKYNDGIYKCDENEYNGNLYKADRKITNTDIGSDFIYLSESILFYSEEIIQNITYYNIYENGLYEKIIFSFTSNDIEKENITLNDYFIKYLYNKRVEYKSKFGINEDHYYWIGTEII